MRRIVDRYTSIITRFVAVFVVIASVLLPFIRFGVADAALITSRSITLSSETASATSVSYAVQFNIGTTGTSDLQGIVLDFCGNDPIIGDTTCTTPSGFSLTGSPTVSNQDSTTGCNLSTFTTVGTLNTNRTLTLTAASAVNTTSGVTCSFTINGVTNPSTTNQTFYARLYTYATSGGATGYTVATPGSYIDAGGFALSTAQQITITSKVQETLTFCVGTTTLPTSGSAATAQTVCSNLSGNTVTLGNTYGVLSTSGPYVDVSTQYIIGTNATGGAAVVVKGATLTSGSNTIAAIGGTATASSAGTSQFGLCTYEGTGSNLVFTNETGGASGAYDNANCSTTTQSAGYGSTGGNGTASFGFNTTATTSASGDPLAKENAGSNSTGILSFLGNISATQVAGIYTTTLSFIATGTY